MTTLKGLQTEITSPLPKPIRLHLEHLEAVRGAAALYVVCNHARYLLFITKEQIHLTGASKVVNLMAQAGTVFAFGHQAVILFFVLSGFCIHLRQARGLMRSADSEALFAFDTRDYLKRRWYRIAPPYYFCLLLTAGLNWLTVRCNPEFAIHLTGINLIDANMLAQHNSLPILLGNLVFVQSLACPTFGNNSALWSLAYEFYLYLLYPIYLAIRRASTLWKSSGIIFLVSALALFWLIRAPNLYFWLLPVLAYWFSWVVGAVLAELCVRYTQVPLRMANPWIMVLTVPVWIASARLLPQGVSDSLGALVCGHLLWVILHSQTRPRWPRFVQMAYTGLTRIGTFSYSLYLIHLPVLALLCAVWYKNHNIAPTMPLLFVCGLCLSLAAGWGTYWLVERRFSTVSHQAAGRTA